MLRSVERQSKAINRLRHLVIMAIRMIALGLLVLAFAQPYIPIKDSPVSKSSYAAIYIDNSLSMGTKGENGPLLNQAREKAIEIIKALPENFKIQIVSNSFDGSQQRYYTKQEAIDLVDAIVVSHAFRDFDEVNTRVKSTWQSIHKKGKGELQLFIISDFQASVFNELGAQELSTNTSLIKLDPLNSSRNIGFDSVWVEQPVLQPSFKQNIQATISNSSPKPYKDLSIQLLIEGELKAAKTIDLKPNGQTKVSFTILPRSVGHYSAQLNLDVGEPYFDNTFYFSYEIKEPLKVLEIDSEGEGKLGTMFADSIFSYQNTSIKSLDFGVMNELELIIINGVDEISSGLSSFLENHLQSGKNVVFIPAKVSINSFETMLALISKPSETSLVSNTIKSSSIAWQDPIFKGVFTDKPNRPNLPVARKYFRLNPNTGYPLISFENGDPLILRVPHGSGQTILFTTNLSLESSNLYRHPVLVPILLNAALYSSAKIPLYTYAGRNNGLVFTKPRVSESPLSIELEDDEIIPKQRQSGTQVELFDLPSKLEDGTYTVKEKGKKRGYLSINTDPRESEWTFLNNDDLDKLSIEENISFYTDNTKLGFTLKGKFDQNFLWKWFLIAALLFLIFEIILLKIWK